MTIPLKTINAVLMIAIGLISSTGCCEDETTASSTTGAGAEYVIYAPSISLRAQLVAIEEVCRFADTNATSIGCVVIIDIKNDDVIAVADCGGQDGDERPFALHKKIEPGHLISPITAAIALDTGAAASVESKFSSDRNEASFAEFRLPSDGHDDNRTETSVSNAILKSSNVVMSKIGILCGARELYDGYAKFGLATALRKPEKWCRGERSRIPIGQGFRVSAIELAKAYAILARGGCTTNGEQVISSTSAESLLAVLEGVVQDGTGHRAAVENIRISGKTSTSLRSSDGWHYEPGKYISAFASIFPADKPQFAMVVWFETARNGNEDNPGWHHGGGRAALASREIIRRLLASPRMCSLGLD